MGVGIAIMLRVTVPQVVSVGITRFRNVAPILHPGFRSGSADELHTHLRAM
jgi:hypothetical protein